MLCLATICWRGLCSRAGLVSDIEIIEDYPSHYSAYNRRKHRWLRGDWQIAGWLLAACAGRIGGPRRESHFADFLVEDCRQFAPQSGGAGYIFLLVVGWFMPGKPWLWTLVTSVHFILSRRGSSSASTCYMRLFIWDLTVARDALPAYTANVLLFMLIFLPHQTCLHWMLSCDRWSGALSRRTGFWNGKRRPSRSSILGDATRSTSISIGCLLLAVLLGDLVWLERRQAIPTALAHLGALGMQQSRFQLAESFSGHGRNQTSRKNVAFLRHAALKTWRYFAEYSTAEHNWLIPDNVQEEPPPLRLRVSPTNIGLLLNARQVACEFGYLTVPELV